MRKFLILPLLALGLAGCGGGHHAARPTLPNGKVAPASWTIHGGRPRSPAFVAGAEATGAPTLPRLGGSLAISGYDAVTLRNILSYTSSPQAVGCYIVGSFANCPEARSRFPNAHIVSITPTASFVSASTKCLDTENGDSTPGQVAGWIRAEIRVGVFRPCDYSPLDEMIFQVEPALRASGLPRSAYLLWVAHWTGIFGVESGFDGQQFFSNCCIDKDAFLSYFFDTKPAPPPVPLCARTMCYFKFSTAQYINPKPGPCHHGCDERSYMYSWQHDVHKSHAKRLYDRYRLQALQRHREYLIAHGHNTQAYRQMAHVLWAAGFEAQWRSNFDKYVEVKG